MDWRQNNNYNYNYLMKTKQLKFEFEMKFCKIIGSLYQPKLLDEFESKIIFLLPGKKDNKKTCWKITYIINFNINIHFVSDKKFFFV